MAITPFHTIQIEECCEPLIQIPKDEFAQDPVYFRNGWSSREEFYIREGVLEKLYRIQVRLAGNYSFLIFDPWRSRKVQGRIFEYYNQKIRSENEGKSEDELKVLVATFVSPANDMSKIPPHSTGGAIDLTLIDSNGDPIDVGSPFDDTTEKAATNFFEGKDSIINGNRQRLLDIMAAEGFVNYPDEWWHFDCGTQLGQLNSNDPKPAIYGEVSDDFKLLHAPKKISALKLER
jgi:D-alanyl-D-alanine dipeptidase